jgi:hypothetical protein
MKKALLLLSSGCMELSWLYAWASFLTISISHRPFPFLEAVTAFILSAGITLFSKEKGWRVISILSLQLLGFIFSALFILYFFNALTNPFLSYAWVVEFFLSLKGASEWLITILILFLTLPFWIGGLTLAKKPMTYFKTCSRFDLGLGAFFLLFLIKLVLLEKGGIKSEDPVSQFMIFPFFIFSLSAIGLARKQGDFQKNFLSGYQGIGVILIFVMAILIFGSGLTLFFLPSLSLVAESGYGILKIVSKPLGYIFVQVIRFLYMRNTLRSESPSLLPQKGIEDFNPPAEEGWWPEFIGKIVSWGLWGALGLILLLAFGLGIYYLLRWLFSKTPASPKKRESLWFRILSWLKRFQDFLLPLLKRGISSTEGYKGAIQIYRTLLSWGRHSGLPHFLSETPNEYGQRLNHQFPSLKGEIDLIIEAFNLEFFGGISLHKEQLAKSLSAWRRLRSPLHWPYRLKSWLLQPTPSPKLSGIEPWRRRIPNR